ncbi:luciferase family protein, partial [Pseudomonas syringae pv. actinidiae ICMP 19073]
MTWEVTMRAEKNYPIKTNPMRSSRNKMQLGVFSTNTEGGCTAAFFKVVVASTV